MRDDFDMLFVPRDMRNDIVVYLLLLLSTPRYVLEVCICICTVGFMGGFLLFGGKICTLSVDMVCLITPCQLAFSDENTVIDM